MLWWKRNQGCFPVVAVVARQILAIPVTSAPSERLFSLAGHLLSKTRNSLGTDVVQALTFVNAQLQSDMEVLQKKRNVEAQ